MTYYKKGLLFIALCLLMFFAGTGMAKVVSQTTSGTVSGNRLSSSWGLSFQNDGQTPLGNESKDKLKEYNSYFVGDESQNKIYITFDAGYENGNMPKILEALKKHNVKATFFVVGNFIRDNPEIVKQMEEYGQMVGNHSFTHPDMSTMDKQSFENELKQLEDSYRELTGKEMVKVYRPPQGTYTYESLSHAKDMGYKTIFWSLAHVDWYDDKQPSYEEAMDKLTKRIHPGAIVLLHSTSSTNAEILDELLTKWEEMGYTFGSLDELQ